VSEDYQKKMGEFYKQISRIIKNEKRIFEDLDNREKLFSSLKIDELMRKQLIFDWYIFDYKNEFYSKTLFQHFFDTAQLSEENRRIYQKFFDNVYSIFEVKTIKMRVGCILRDLATGKEYNLRDTSVASSIRKGQVIILRLLPFSDFYIASNDGFAFSLSSSSALRLSFSINKSADENFKLTPLHIFEFFKTAEDSKHKDEKAHFINLCRMAGMTEKEIDMFVEKTKSVAENRGDYKKNLRELVTHIDPFKEVPFPDISDAFVGLYNYFISEKYPEYRKGPLEYSLLDVCVSYVANKVLPGKFKSSKAAQAEAQKLQDKWLKTPFQELDNKTPTEVILEERAALGNPDRKVKFEYDILSWSGEEEGNPAEEAFNRGVTYMQKRRFEKAIKAFKENLVLEPGNYSAWLNLGVAYTMLIDKALAQKCFRKALQINPQYENAAKNLKLLRNVSKKDMKEMAKEYRIKSAKEDDEQ